LRADNWLVQAGLAPTRTAAQRLIHAGSVQFGAEPVRLVRKAGELIAAHETLEVINCAEIQYVSRAGLKLAFALDHFAVSAQSKHCLDVGQSTGGFTDCLLQRGASAVVGVDVGHDQVHPKIRANAAVTIFENLNIRDEQALAQLEAVAPFDLAVVDVSFISLGKVLPNVLRLLKPDGLLLALYKPQFEVGAAYIGKRGIVKDLKRVEQQLAISLSEYQQFAQIVNQPVKAGITGADGNQEYVFTLRSI
jgi:23S rRNA (cytidine1920-2'-O)/16S rRNA (cytidine1409-2'-O)-methyltransferase